MLISSQSHTHITSASRRLSLTTGQLYLRSERRSNHVWAHTNAPVKQRVPRCSWDSHMHVVEPEQFPISKTAAYQPSAHTLAEALEFESTVGVENLVFVQPSIYGTDNSCLLAALSKLGPSRGRGVVVVDPATIQQNTLKEWHALGVRGLRVNLQSVGKVMEKAELEETLRQHAEIARPLNWIIELYLPLKQVPMLESIVPHLDVTVCIDHFGSPDLSSIQKTESTPFDPYTLPGFTSLMSLIQGGKTYIKISAPYRLTSDGNMNELKAMAREFLSAAPNRTIYATDWPHTRFTGVDINPFTEWCLDLCDHESGLAEKVFRRNTEAMLSVNFD
ncbi:Amidohydrolase 2 [Penicillium taxi]|uniref:Amidohydrolase 2 n=1 Tax=Penicillium taxi TaxID=168475 RepID=UPI002544D6F8|nr:Amidohydrolase 2 [Penicillium taxi]KAJ5901722.1 Amidohydrolase 2 [Penicillium taxi]